MESRATSTLGFNPIARPNSLAYQAPDKYEPEEESIVYTVRHNDSLNKISYLTGVSVRIIKKDNGLLNDVLIPG